jgi:pyoverdine/dityrosine biosynthesis protein Dit1
MPRPGGGSIGHSKHRKAFGSKQHKSTFNRIRLQKAEDAKVDEATRISNAHKNKTYSSIHDLFNKEGHR